MWLKCPRNSKSTWPRCPVSATDDQALSGNLVIEMQRRYRSQAESASRTNALRSSDTRLQSADPGYATRAGANNAHFLLARPSVDTDALAYVGLTLKVGSEINAIGVYSWFHVSALQKASRLANEQLSPEQKQVLALSMLADEAFALHFLEDTFAAGHVAGTWGDTSQRKGTHDFYNQNGLEVFIWTPGRSSIVLMGDAYMRRPQDAQVAANAVRVSLEQVLDTAAGKAGDNAFKHAPGAPATPDAFNVCTSMTLPRREPGTEVPPSVAPILGQVLRQTPVPALGAGLGSVPRFRSELGPFVGLASSVDVEHIDGGFVCVGERAGLGRWARPVVSRRGWGWTGFWEMPATGWSLSQPAFVRTRRSTNKYSNSTVANQSGSLTSAIPARVGLSTRLRMPFYLIPGDLLFLSPLYLTSPETYTGMAVTASNGGLIPWQSGWATGIGRFQFVLGRELGVTFYGRMSDDTIVVPSATPGGPGQIVQYTSTAFDLPILEYRPYRSFNGNQSSSVLIQLFVDADVPSLGPVVSPAGTSVPNGQTVWGVGLRMVFDWRHYY